MEDSGLASQSLLYEVWFPIALNVQKYLDSKGTSQSLLYEVWFPMSYRLQITEFMVAIPSL